MLVQLGEAIERVERDRGVRCAILTGAGVGFCSGLDIKDADGRDRHRRRRITRAAVPAAASLSRTSDLPTITLHEMNTPIIAALNGAAAGYGLDLALGCDLRVAAAERTPAAGLREARHRPRERRHLVPARVSSAGPRPRRSPTSAATSPPTEAKAYGIVNEVAPDDELMDLARDWAGEIAANAPLAVQAMKRLFRAGMNEDFRTHSEHVLLQLGSLMATQRLPGGPRELHGAAGARTSRVARPVTSTPTSSTAV